MKLVKEVKYKEKAELFVIGSRIRERDKKNTEYYVGDYCSYEYFYQRKVFKSQL